MDTEMKPDLKPVQNTPPKKGAPISSYGLTCFGRCDMWVDDARELLKGLNAVCDATAAAEQAILAMRPVKSQTLSLTTVTAGNFPFLGTLITPEFLVDWSRGFLFRELVLGIVPSHGVPHAIRAGVGFESNARLWFATTQVTQGLKARFVFEPATGDRRRPCLDLREWNPVADDRVLTTVATLSD